MKKRLKVKAMIGGCVWCDDVILAPTCETLTESLKRHVLEVCKKHPMRKKERKIKRLEKMK